MQQLKHNQRKKPADSQEKARSRRTKENSNKKGKGLVAEAVTRTYSHDSQVQLNCKRNEAPYLGENLDIIQEFQSLWNDLSPEESLCKSVT